MAGIYIHVPFCRQACHYCNFHFSTSLNRKNDFVTALLKEMELQKEYIGETIETIYFGGGTPSLLDQGELERIMEGLYAHFTIAPGAEITLEANPDDIALPAATDPPDRIPSRTPDPSLFIASSDPSPFSESSSSSSPFIASPDPSSLIASPKLSAWKQAGINRLSIGVQSFFEEDLRWMNRAHTAGQALAAIRLAQEAGYGNISIDLIYGGPTLTDDHWKKNVEQAIRLEVPHLSCYALTVEPRTALDHLIRGKERAPVDPDAQARQFLLLTDWLAAAGYEHYEISNFAIPGRRSRHNTSYWQGATYLGLGPSAHAYNGASRQWNVANNTRYIDSLLAGQLNFEKEQLSPVQQLNEYIMISLRTLEGCDLQQVSERFGEDAARKLLVQAERYIREGMMEDREGMIKGRAGMIKDPAEDNKLGAGYDEQDENTDQDEIGTGGPAKLVLTREGRLFADGIAADLFF